MARKSRSANVLYPEEREGRVKNANKELKSQVNNLKKKIKQLEEENRTLRRSFNKNADYIDKKLEDKSLEQVLEMVKNFDYKETEKGREKELVKQKQITNFISKKCPDCGKMEDEGYTILKYHSFNVLTCKCGFRKKVNEGEGIERG